MENMFYLMNFLCCVQFRIARNWRDRAARIQLARA